MSKQKLRETLPGPETHDELLGSVLGLDETEPEPEPATPEPQRALRWQVTLGGSRKQAPMVVYNVTSDRQITADEAYAKFLKDTGRDGRDIARRNIPHNCTPLPY